MEIHKSFRRPVNAASHPLESYLGSILPDVPYYLTRMTAMQNIEGNLQSAAAATISKATVMQMSRCLTTSLGRGNEQYIKNLNQKSWYPARNLAWIDRSLASPYSVLAVFIVCISRGYNGQ